MKHPRAFRVFLLGSVAAWAVVSGTWPAVAATPGKNSLSSMAHPLGTRFTSWVDELPFFGSGGIQEPSGSVDPSGDNSISPEPVPVPLPEQPPVVAQPHDPTVLPDPPAQQSPSASSPSPVSSHPMASGDANATPETALPVSSGSRETVSTAQQAVLQSGPMATTPAAPMTQPSSPVSSAQTNEMPASFSSQMTVTQLQRLPKAQLTKQMDQQAQQVAQNVNLAGIKAPIEVQAERLDGTHAHMSLALSPTLSLEHATLSNLKIIYQADNGAKIVIEVPQAQAENLIIQSSLLYYVPTALKMLNTPLSLLALLLGNEVNHLSLSNVSLKVSQFISAGSMDSNGLSLSIGQ
ncbi:MAG: hypothetical protein IMW91_09020 [Firmicutes bacterium]|nr:hypothetical protein [Bacillota bacterium]